MLYIRTQPTAQQNIANTASATIAADAQGCTAPKASGAASTVKTTMLWAARNQRELFQLAAAATSAPLRRSTTAGVVVSASSLMGSPLASQALMKLNRARTL